MNALPASASAAPPRACGFGGGDRIERLRDEVAAYERLLASLVAAFEARVPGALRHGARVARIASAIGRRLGLAEESVVRIRRGAALHDIGLLVLSPKILRAAGPSRPGRLDELQAHPVLGYALLKGIPSLEPLLPFVHRHHERLDGSGFPDGLSGVEIPLAVQVVSIADAFEELTTAAPPRLRLSRPQALETLRDEASRGEWDPALVEHLEQETAKGRTCSAARVRAAPSSPPARLAAAGGEARPS